MFKRKNKKRKVMGGEDGGTSFEQRETEQAIDEEAVNKVLRDVQKNIPERVEACCWTGFRFDK